MSELNLEQARYNMIEQQVRPWDVLDQQVLDVMGRVPREAFVPEKYQALAFADINIPLGHDQVMMAPKVEGRLLQALAVHQSDSVLEIGTGCGYQTAVLAPLVKKIYTVERIPELLKRTRQRLRELDIYNVQFRPGDGWAGWPKYAPYDGIIVTAAAPQIPEKLLEQLAPGGRMVIPVGPMGCQDLLLVTRRDDHFEEVSLGAVSFVPLVPGK